MPYQHNKKQDRKPTKRTDRPARRTATHGTKRETTRSNAPHMRGAGANTKVHQEQHRVMPPTTHALILHIRCATPNVIYQSGSLSPSSPLSQSHSHSAPAPPAPQANRTTKERLLPRTKLPLKANDHAFLRGRLHTRHRRGLRSLYQLQRKIQRSGRPRLFLRERG